MHSFHSGRTTRRRRGAAGGHCLGRNAFWLVLLVGFSWAIGFFGVILFQIRRSVNLPDGGPSKEQRPNAVHSPQNVVKAYLRSAQRINPGGESGAGVNRLSAGSVFDTSVFPHLHPPTQAKFESPLLIFTCKRAEYLETTLQGILENIPNPCTLGCPVIVSQDGADPQVQLVIKKFASKFMAEKNVPVLHMQHEQSGPVRGSRRVNPYLALAQHYGWALTQVFDNTFDKLNVKSSSPAEALSEAFPIPQRVVILEEDLNIAPDFFDYFAAMAPLLDQDSDLLAVSAFNDNGHRVDLKATHRVLRSDFFPGLGWMMTRSLWKSELQSKWPNGYWDDWLREPQQRKGRHIIRPEVSRTFHFGSKGGASNNQFGNLLTQVKLNAERVEWHKDKDAEAAASLARLSPVTEYDADYTKLVLDSVMADSVHAALSLDSQGKNVRVEYRDFQQFQQFARQLTLMNDEKAGVPRTAYRGIVETRLDADSSRILFLTPPESEWRSKMSV